MTICTGAGPLRGGGRPATRNNTFTGTHGSEDDLWAKVARLGQEFLSRNLETNLNESFTCTVDTDPSIAAVHARLLKFRRSTVNFANGNSNPSANLNASGSTSGKTNGQTSTADAGVGIGIGIYENRQHLFTHATNISSSSKNATVSSTAFLAINVASNNDFFSSSSSSPLYFHLLQHSTMHLTLSLLRWGFFVSGVQKASVSVFLKKPEVLLATEEDANGRGQGKGRIDQEEAAVDVAWLNESECLLLIASVKPVFSAKRMKAADSTVQLGKHSPASILALANMQVLQMRYSKDIISH
ncbi:hypothetical protein F5876DRAFT_66694 [Lentinula aff. lateritia]|uniref:Uncharacterized protein n=1 Tax=Lentinula aff. lateritia TaxID=2804960 RepID=A0ACC1TWK1_9AGAR|nr:hypothetical protein F5876DRAFT_66694 [Lentinula aff. lateritia]